MQAVASTVAATLFGCLVSSASWADCNYCRDQAVDMRRRAEEERRKPAQRELREQAARLYLATAQEYEEEYRACLAGHASAKCRPDQGSAPTRDTSQDPNLSEFKRPRRATPPSQADDDDDITSPEEEERLQADWLQRQSTEATARHRAANQRQREILAGLCGSRSDGRQCSWNAEEPSLGSSPQVTRTPAARSDGGWDLAQPEKPAPGEFEPLATEPSSEATLAKAMLESEAWESAYAPQVASTSPGGVEGSAPWPTMDQLSAELEQVDKALDAATEAVLPRPTPFSSLLGAFDGGAGRGAEALSDLHQLAMGKGSPLEDLRTAGDLAAVAAPNELAAGNLRQATSLGIGALERSERTWTGGESPLSDDEAFLTGLERGDPRAIARLIPGGEGALRLLGRIEGGVRSVTATGREIRRVAKEALGAADLVLAPVVDTFNSAIESLFGSSGAEE